MSNLRASIFENVPDVDVSAFSPKSQPDHKAPSQEEVKAVAEAANFPSRQAPSAGSTKTSKKREVRIHRTGRNVQFNAKVSQETVNDIYDVTEANKGWVLGYTLERAIAALKRELAMEKTS